MALLISQLHCKSTGSIKRYEVSDRNKNRFHIFVCSQCSTVSSLTNVKKAVFLFGETDGGKSTLLDFLSNAVKLPNVIYENRSKFFEIWVAKKARYFGLFWACHLFGYANMPGEGDFYDEQFELFKPVIDEYRVRNQRILQL